MARSHPVSAGLVWLADNLTSREGRPDMVNEWTSNDVPSVSSLGLYDKRPDLDLDAMRFGAAVALEAVVKHLNTHYPKPRPVTRQDLPDDPDDRWETFRSRFKAFDGYRSEAHQHSLWTVFRSGAEYAETRILDHLNANGVAPAPGVLSSAADCVLESAEQVRAAKAEADRWRRAHSIVEGERDQARDERDEAKAARREAWEHLDKAADRVVHEQTRAQDAEHDRDEWQARAEAAEARTAPAVTRDDVKGVIDHWIKQGGNHEALLDDLWRWVSGADPAVFVVRESQLPDVERNEDGDWLCEKALVVNGRDTAEDLRGRALPQLKHVAMREAVARAIEAEQAADPVEEKAEELMRILAPETEDRTWGILTEPAREDFRRLARHVLGQEASDE